MKYVLLWLICALASIAFCMWVDPYMKRRDLPLVIAYNVVVWPIVAAVVAWIEFVQPRLDSDWWDAPVRKDSE